MPRALAQSLNSSVWCNGTSGGQVFIGNETYLDGLPFSVYGWLRTDNLSRGALFGYGYSFSNNKGYSVECRNTSLSISSGTSNVTIPTTSAIRPSSWVWFGVTYDGSSVVTGYVNGVTIGTTTMTARVADSVQKTVILAGAHSYFQNGCMVGIHDVVLSPQEMMQAFQGAQVGRGSVGFYPLQNTSAKDVSGNGLNGTISNASWSTDVPANSRSGVSSSPRVGVRNLNCSLSLNGFGNTIQSPSALGASSTAFTFMQWMKLNDPSGGVFKYVASNHGVSNSGGFKLRVNQGSLQLFVYNGTTASSTSGTGNFTVSTDRFYPVAVTYNNGVGTIYVNNIVVASASGLAMSSSVDPIFIGGDSSTTNNISMKVSGAAFYNGMALTPSQIAQYFNQNIIPGAPTFLYQCNEGAGNTAYDNIGGNNGTITNGTYTADVPSKTRSLVGGNMVYNGNFEFAPPVNVAYTVGSNYRWIDGTSGGSSTNGLFGWQQFDYAGSIAILFDSVSTHSGSYALKLSTTATASKVVVASIANNSNIGKGLYSNAPSIILLKPSTPYTASLWIKTIANSGSANTGAYAYIQEYNGNISTVQTTNIVNGITTTTGWTRYTVTFTTTASTYWGNVVLNVVGNDGAGTLIMDAWFDDIVLVPTTTPTRSGAV